MKYMVVFKCTSFERDGVCRGGGGEPLPLDRYMVSNKLFDTMPEAQHYGDSLPLSRQARVMKLASFRCPKTGDWLQEDD